MSDHDHDAFDALRRLDGPAGLDDGVEDRIEAEMLARFDERAASATTADDAPIVELATEMDRRGRRPNRMMIALSSAAALVAVIGGFTLLAGRDDPVDPVDPVDDPPPSTSTIPVDATVTEQLAAFCAQAVLPAREADAGWEPSGLGSEARLVLIVAVEQAADAAGAVESPLADRWGDFPARLLDAATNARLVTSLGETDGDAAVEAARDLLFTVGAAAGVTPPASCLPPGDGS